MLPHPQHAHTGLLSILEYRALHQGSVFAFPSTRNIFYLEHSLYQIITGFFSLFRVSAQMLSLPKDLSRIPFLKQRPLPTSTDYINLFYYLYEIHHYLILIIDCLCVLGCSFPKSRDLVLLNSCFLSTMTGTYQVHSKQCLNERINYPVKL